MPNLSKPRESFSTGFWLKTILIVSLVLSLLAGFFVNNRFRIKEVEIKPSKLNFVPLGWLLNQNLLALNTTKAGAKILADNPIIETVELTKVYPEKLKVMLTLSQPILQIKTNGYYLLISAGGKIISRRHQPQPNLLSVDYYQKIRSYESRPGARIINQDLLTAVNIVNQIPPLDQRISQISIDKPEQIKIQLDHQGPLITFNSKKNIAKSWRIVHNILKSLKIKGQKPIEINLLFDKPYFIL